MEEQENIKKNKKGKKRKTFLIILLILIIACSGLFVYYKFFMRHGLEDEDARVIDKIDLYDYRIYENATEYYKEEFRKLKKMSTDEDLKDEDHASQVAKLFVIDLFSINYKLNKYEITSSQYYYSKKQDMYTQKVLDTIYNMVEDNYNLDRKQELPEVTNVEVTNIKEDKYELGSKNKDCWVVEMNITYAKDLGYDKKCQVILVADGKNYSVVNYKAL